MVDYEAIIAENKAEVARCLKDYQDFYSQEKYPEALDRVVSAKWSLGAWATARAMGEGNVHRDRDLAEAERQVRDCYYQLRWHIEPIDRNPVAS